MKCPKCGKKLYSDTLTRCPFCGSEIASKEPDKVSHKEEMELLFSNDKGVTARGVSNHPVRKASPSNLKENFMALDDDIPTFSEPTVPATKKPENPQTVASATSTEVSSPETEEIKPETKPLKAVPDVQPESPQPQPEKQLQSDNNASTDVHIEPVAPGPDGMAQEEKATPALPPRKSKLQELLRRRKKKSKNIDTKEHIEEALGETNPEIEESAEIGAEESEAEKDAYDSNADGYYDDLIPDLAKEINKIPQENIIKVVIMAVFGVIAAFVILTAM